MLADVPLAKASHVTKLKVNVRGLPMDVNVGRFYSLRTIFATITHTHTHTQE
jgi:hypothetical protein